MVGRRLLGFSVRLDTRPTRFLLVGISGVGVNTGVLWLATRGGLIPFWAGLAASLVSTGTNFLLNDAFTWRDRREAGPRPTAARMLRYYGTTAVGNLIYLGVLTLLIQSADLFYLVANLVAIGVGGTVNYLIHNAWTWRGARS
jgi:putative flippase GtrA